MTENRGAKEDYVSWLAALSKHAVADVEATMDVSTVYVPLVRPERLSSMQSLLLHQRLSSETVLSDVAGSGCTQSAETRCP